MAALSPTPLYQTESIRFCEQMAISDLGLAEEELMARAGSSAFSTIKKLYPSVRTLVVFCGGGNNAGDGYVLARIAHEAGFSVVINQYKTIESLPKAARHAASAAMSAGVNFQRIDAPIDPQSELIVDALLGIGLKGDIRGSLVATIQQINESNLPVISLDIPSGLNADSGKVMGVCVRATFTVTFIARKLGMMTLDGPDYCGEVICHDLRLAQCISTIAPVAYVLNESSCGSPLPKRLKNSHKGHFGHVLIIGGNHGMPGSVALSAQAALRVGAGLVTVATKPEHARQMLSGLPEAMIYGIDQVEDLLPLLAKATVCVIGPGLGEDAWASELFLKTVTQSLPFVIDASALRLLAQHPQRNTNWVLTPHPGEAADMLHSSIAQVQSDRVITTLLLQCAYAGTIVLKGVGSIVRTDEPAVYLCAAGNPGMASAGMGDVLSGVIAGLIAQGLSPTQAAKLGVWVHASAADEAVAIMGERGLLASDLMPFLRQQVNL